MGVSTPLPNYWNVINPIQSSENQGLSEADSTNFVYIYNANVLVKGLLMILFKNHPSILLHMIETIMILALIVAVPIE
jgi:hypothetical protein